MNEREPILYRWWGEDGTLLYVGKSISLFARIAAHRKSSGFFPSAATMTIERFPDEAALAIAEVVAIREEHPLHNVAHNRAAGSPRMLLPETPEEKQVASHWTTISAEAIEIGDLVRWTLDDEVTMQGLVDEHLYDCGDCDDPGACIGWVIWADDGSVEYCHSWEFGLGLLEKWVSIDAEDETIANSFGAWLHGQARLGYMAGVAS